MMRLDIWTDYDIFIIQIESWKWRNFKIEIWPSKHQITPDLTFSGKNMDHFGKKITIAQSCKFTRTKSVCMLLLGVFLLKSPLQPKSTKKSHNLKWSFFHKKIWILLVQCREVVFIPLWWIFKDLFFLYIKI